MSCNWLFSYSCHKIMALRIVQNEINQFFQAIPTSCLEIKAKKVTVTVGTFTVTVGTRHCSTDIRFL